MTTLISLMPATFSKFVLLKPIHRNWMDKQTNKQTSDQNWGHNRDGTSCAEFSDNSKLGISSQFGATCFECVRACVRANILE